MIPHLFTLGNLFLGCCAIIAVIEINQSYDFTQPDQWGMHKWIVPLLVIIAAFLDLLDGLIARALRVPSELGKQLDSLADMVTFGVLPSMIAYAFFTKVTTSFALPLIAFILALAACWRLAKFNIDTRQTTNFRGLATPASALFFVGLWPSLFNHDAIVSQMWFLILVTVSISVLMVSDLPMFSAKIKSFNFMDNFWLYSFLILSIIWVIAYHFLGLSFGILTYIVLSLVKMIVGDRKVKVEKGIREEEV